MKKLILLLSLSVFLNNQSASVEEDNLITTNVLASEAAFSDDPIHPPTNVNK